jgi:hypothetical protein
VTLAVLTAAKTTALLTRAAVKARLGIGDAVTTHDETLDALIAAVSAAAVRVVVGAGPATGARALVAQRYRSAQPGPDRDILLLPRRPLDPATVAVELDGTALVLDTDYSIASAAQGSLYRSAWWPSKYRAPGMDGDANVVATFWAGYVPPAASYEWSATTARAVGDWLRPTNLATTALRFRVSAAAGSKLTGATEPDWTTYDAGDEITDGDLTLVAHELPEAPADLLQGAYFALQTWFRSGPILEGLAAERRGAHSLEYHNQADALANALPMPTLALWEPLSW